MTNQDATVERWAVATGSSRGIGAAAALRLARDGWNVVVHHRGSADEANGVAAAVQALGRRACVFQADFAEPSAGPALVDAVWAEVGRVHAWVHNAGIDLLTGPAAKMPFEEKLSAAWRVDVVGTLVTCRAVGRRMRDAGGGAIVTIGWDQSAVGMDGDSGELFAATKGAVTAFSRSLAKSLAPTVRVNCVAPGWIKTAWGESAPAAWQDRAVGEALLKRWGTPDDVATMIAFAVSDEAAFLTGQTFNVNGGVVTS
ncbi:MAG: SDR family NAD(P)-dependent oxidoreductase [Planctomycetia bacterium]